jgi:predicted nuclease with RNAse H fold
VDVGGPRKGFDVALVDAVRLTRLERFGEAGEAAAWLARHRAQLVGIDSPRHPAPPGERSRPDERELAAAVCGIRFTPDEASLRAPHRSGYYDWILNGLALYAALEEAGLHAIECFPTATWTRLHRPRGAQSRAAWSREALEGAGLRGVPPRLSQDARDAIGAALTARLHAEGRTELCGEIVVPA